MTTIKYKCISILPLTYSASEYLSKQFGYKTERAETGMYKIAKAYYKYKKNIPCTKPLKSLHFRTWKKRHKF